MKKLICLLMIACLLIPTAVADSAPQLDSKMFDYAKRALYCLSSGEYGRLVTHLPFSDVSPSADEWESFVGNFRELSEPQSEYAVAYWNGACWNVAVPVYEPTDSNVEVFVLTSFDGVSFSGYRYDIWGQIEFEYAQSEHVTWNKEYAGSTPMVFIG